MRARFADLSYDDAVQYVLKTLDEVANSLSQLLCLDEMGASVRPALGP